MTPEEIIDVVVDRGSWTARRDELEVDPVVLRRQLRAAAKDRGIRVLTSSAGGLFTVYWPEHEPTEQQIAALHRALRSAVDDERPITYDQALEQVRREQIRAV